ncbi:exported protein [Azorhizobium oxalatiphilum]|uniref:Exported protein n=1 Tax=Azorhizobium oxalatiphilum TaxID=980631 RepID=A0A917CDM4_9HYPH|nr:ABC transporter substrate-binding protein [Azorhizobium oxalatiphilum]GGF82617.1 exported protein [Azorhizobium oxalatiphilum]
MLFSRFNRAYRVALGLGLAAGLQMTGGLAHAADKVLIGLAIPPTVTDGGIYAIGDEMGLFKAENIEVESVVLAGAGTIVPQLLQKKITLGFPLPETLLSAHKAGEAPLPLTYVYNANPYNSLELSVLESSNIKSIQDLKGAKIGVGALTWGTIPQTRALLRSVGLEPGKDVSIVAVGNLGSGFHALREQRVEALNFNSTWIDLMELEGTKARRLPYPPVFANMIVNGFLAHADTLKEQPDLLARFGRAYSQAVIACDANPKACVEAFWKRTPTARPQGDTAKALADNIEILKRRLALVVRDAAGKDRVPGEFDLATIKAYVEAMNKYGEFTTADMPLDAYFSNKLVPDYGKFDRAALIAKAKALP